MRTSPIHQNKARFWILEQYRGYRKGRLLFSGFPSDITWRRVALDEPNELDRLRYAKEGGANRVDSPPSVQYWPVGADSPAFLPHVFRIKPSL